MSAPLVVNTTDGTVWTRREATRDGLALYAPEKCAGCPEFVMATYAELEGHGVAGSADVLPMPVPVGPEPQGREAAKARVRAKVEASRAMPARERIYHLLCATYTHAEAEAMLAEVDGRHELERLSARVAELEALTPARIQTCRVCGAGYTYGEPCSSCLFRARMAAELQARGLDGEHYPYAHHDYRVGHDLPETGGQR